MGHWYDDTTGLKSLVHTQISRNMRRERGSLNTKTNTRTKQKYDHTFTSIILNGGEELDDLCVACVCSPFHRWSVQNNTPEYNVQHYTRLVQSWRWKIGRSSTRKNWWRWETTKPKDWRKRFPIFWNVYMYTHAQVSSFFLLNFHRVCISHHIDNQKQTTTKKKWKPSHWITSQQAMMTVAAIVLINKSDSEPAVTHLHHHIYDPISGSSEG